ncbi:MAG: HPF/RaiA family ribosome-associated protein [Steroidobacteraceae bacterium]
MQSPMTLTFRHIDRSGALEERARKLGHHLARFNERITHCHMTLQGPENPGGGAAYLVKIDLTVPGAHIHADSLHLDGAGHDDVYLALRDAFNNAKRQLLGLPAVRGRKPDATGLAGAGGGQV